PRRDRRHGVHHLRPVRRRVGVGRRLAVPAHDLRRQPVRGRDHPPDGGDRRRGGRVPVRRLRPHAQRRRRRHLLDRHGRVAARRQDGGGGHGRDRADVAHRRRGRGRVGVMTAVAQTPPTTVRRGGSPARPLRMLVGILGVCVVAWLTANVFLSLAYYPGWYFHNRVLMALVGMVAGLGGAALLFYFINVTIESLPQRLSQGLIPYAFVLPAFGLIGLMLLYPTIQTINYSFANNDSIRYVGLDNYRSIFADSAFWLALTNNALWLIIVPALTVVIGIAVALFADRLSAKGENVAKSLIFLPMAVSFVGASTIWGVLIYSANPNIGILNAILGTSIDWIQQDTARLNSLLMMVILIWMQSGFAMVLLSGAIKAVPDETLE